MNAKPLDLRQHHFRTRLNGFDKVEVAAFLVSVADEYERTVRETDKLRQDVARLEADLGEHRDGETNLKNTLLTAQRLSDEMKEHADQEAKRIVREADGRAALLLEKAQVRLDEMQRDIDSLVLKRREVETTLEATIQTLRTTLEYVRDRAERENDEKILLHRPRQAVEPQAQSDEIAPLESARSR